MTNGLLNPQELSTTTGYRDQYLNDVVYSDIDLKFLPHPISGDISIVQDVNAVKKALQYLILTKYGDRPFQPNFGSALAEQLFEPVNLDYVTISESIRRTILINEPRVKVHEVIVSVDERNNQNRAGVSITYLNDDHNSIHVHISFKIKHFKELITMDLTLRRSR